MRSEGPALMPIFRSRHQADVLAWLFLHPNQEYTITDLAKRLDVPLPTLHREIQRLVDAELLRARTIGRSRLVRANTDNRAAAPLTQLLELTFGPHVVLSEEFDIPGVEEALIFGSWAERYQGSTGPPPNDVDVLLVGTPDRGDVYDAADRAQTRLGLPVNPVVRTPDQWRENGDPLAKQIKTSATVTVISAQPAPA
jgi:hypothetical protein